MISTLLKITFSILIIGLLLNKINLNDLIPLFKQVSFGWSLLSLLFIWIGLFAIALRWQWILRSMECEKINYKILIRLVFIGFFFNQGLPSTIGGDIYRVMALKNINKSIVLTSVLNDRLFGVFAMIILCLATIPWQWGLIKDSALMEMMIFSSVVVLSGIICLLFFHKLPFKIHKKLDFLNKTSKILYKSWLKDGLKILTVALFAMLLCVLPFYFIAQDLQIDISLLQITSIIPLVLLIGSLPISFAGWGIREGILVFSLAYYGVNGEKALAISIVFGILQLLAAVPGLMLYITGKHNS